MFSHVAQPYFKLKFDIIILTQLFFYADNYSLGRNILVKLNKYVLFYVSLYDGRTQYKNMYYRFNAIYFCGYSASW